MATAKAETPKPQVTELWIGAFDALLKAWNYLKTYYKPVLVVAAIVFVLAIAESLTSGAASYAATGAGSLVSLIFILAGTKYGLLAANNTPATNDIVFALDLKRWLILVGASIIASVLSVLSLALLIIPAIWVFPWLSLYAFASVDKNLGVIASLKESKRLAANHKSKIWAIFGVTILLSFATSIVTGFFDAVWAPLGIVLTAEVQLVTSLLSVIMLAQFYHWSKAQPAEVNPQ